MDKNIDEFQESLHENQERNYGQIDALEGIIKVQHKLNDQLKSRIEDQKEIITLLKIKNSEVNERQESKQNQSFSSDSTDNHGMNPPLTSQQCSKINGQLEWTKAEKKKRNRRPNVLKSQGQPVPSTLNGNVFGRKLGSSFTKTKYQPTPMSTATIGPQQHPQQRTFEFEELYNVETQNDDCNEYLEEQHKENHHDENDETDENCCSIASESQQK
ncbi:hypothetical protein HHI36_014772 [Cryptolaemus montrouzieri]|uniref:Uncharacterized protein n=1 Tax=Cryptolaemus montrouzieri TaxID=559131 RepID=A0ABD2N3Z3_9CUCU